VRAERERGPTRTSREDGESADLDWQGLGSPSPWGGGRGALRFRHMSRELKLLGKKSIISDEQLAAPASILEVFPNPNPKRDYEILFTFPEFTSVCPVTGQPDFATIRLQYVPDKLCVEMKSLKLYYYSFRQKGIFYEAVTNQIADDLIEALKPRELVLVADFAVRGGTAGTVTVRHKAKGRK
jgi:7-cyano-7-deazaguanine reductase